MSAELERSYRRALGWYPRSWREKNADVVAGTLLDVADAEHRTRPRRGELVNLAASGISTRLGVLLEPQARNAISTIALATGFIFSLAYFAFGSWAPWSAELALSARYFSSFGPFTNPAIVVFGLWAIAALNAFMRNTRGLRLAASVTITTSIALPLIQHLTPVEWLGQSTTALGFLTLLGVLVLLGEPAHNARLWAALGGSFVVFAAGYLVLVTNGSVRIGNAPNASLWLYQLAFVVIGCTIAAIVFGLRNQTAAAQTVLVSVVPWAAMLGLVCLSRDHWNTLAFLGIAAALVGFGALLPLAFRRAQPTRPPRTTYPPRGI